MTEEFESVGRSAQQALERLRKEDPERFVPDPSLIDFQDLPPTKDLDAVLTASRLHLADLRQNPISNRGLIHKATRSVQAAEQRAAWGRTRDRIAATRPPDCWCLGYGGRSPRAVPMPTDYTFRGYKDIEQTVMVEREVLREHCNCPEGEARAERDAEVIAEYRARTLQRRIVRRFGDAKLPPEYRAYRWRDHPDRPVVARVERWMTDPKTGTDGKPHPDAHHWLILYGPGGRGKTTIAGGVAAELAEAGLSVLFRPMTDLISDIRATFKKPDEQEELRQLLRSVAWLFLDDLGVEIPRDWVGEFIFEILNHRHNEHLATVLTSNLGPRELAAHVGERIWGRIKRMAEPVEMSGSDLRDLPHTGGKKVLR